MNLLFFLFLLYIAAPKIDLLGGGAPVRPEDFISVIAAAAFLLMRPRKPLPMPAPVRIYCLFIIASFVSAAVNYPREGLISFVFAARLVQYLIWFFILHEACLTLQPRAIRASLLALCLLFIVWGVLEYSGVLGRIGRFTGATQRLTINTSGPFETSVMLATLAYAVPQMVTSGILTVLVLLTQARITVLGMAASFLVARPRRSILITLIVGSLALILAGPVLSLLSSSRFAESQSPTAMLDLLAYTWRKAPIVTEPAWFRDRFLSGETLGHYLASKDGDLSFAIRAVRWPIVVKSTLFTPVPLLIGWGPGAWGIALDSYYVRVFGETGIVGFGLLIWWIVSLMRTCHQRGTVRFTIVMMAIVAVFIDIFTSSKMMPILWGFLGLEAALHPAAFPLPSDEPPSWRAFRARWAAFRQGAAPVAGLLAAPSRPH